MAIGANCEQRCRAREHGRLDFTTLTFTLGLATTEYLLV
jgi:hypothetical protein